MDERVSDWSELLPELLEMIVVRLVSMKDVVMFRGVCTSWRAVATKDMFPAVSKIPLLMLAGKDESHKRKLYSFSGKKICASIPFSEAKGKRCMDVGFGWILTLPSFGGKVSLVKPFTGAKIDLPGYECLPRDNEETHVPEYYYIILSEDPMDGTSDFDLVVLAHGLKRLGLGLAFWRQRNRTWRRIKDEMFYPMEPRHIHLGDYSNLGRYKNKLYAIDHWGGNLWEWDPRTCCFVKTAVVFMGSLKYMPYLAESSNGDLLVIIRLVDKEVHNYWELICFSVYRIDVTKHWMESIGNDAVFIGDNVAVSVSADEFPAGVIEPDCIYFTARVGWREIGRTMIQIRLVIKKEVAKAWEFFTMVIRPQRGLNLTLQGYSLGQFVTNKVAGLKLNPLATSAHHCGYFLGFNFLQFIGCSFDLLEISFSF